jgi:hypothetical protein
MIYAIFEQYEWYKILFYKIIFNHYNTKYLNIH